MCRLAGLASYVAAALAALLRGAPGLLLLLAAWAAAASPGFSETPAQRALACTGCHGEQGRSTPEGYVPRLAGKPATYLYEQLQAFRDGRRQHRGMARLLDNSDDLLLWQLAAHFAGLDLPYPRPAAPPALLAEPGPAARARQIVLQGLPQARVPACAACHGASLMGDGARVPGLLGLPSEYLLAQLGAWRRGLRHAREPDCMAEVARRLAPADLPLVAAWLAAQPVPRPAQPRAETVAPASAAPALHGLSCAGGPTGPATLPAPPAHAAEPGTLVARGAYLARLGNCAGCHARPGSSELSGGAALPTPFGAVYAGNLTPDAATGLGRWTAEDFWRALHLGRGRDGRRLVPAFPYTSYTLLTREDSDALFAFFMSLAPVERERPAHRLRFPYGTQAALALWQALYLRPGAAPAAGAPGDPELARGRYLVEGPGHCLECHAPRGRWGQRGAQPSGALMPAGDWWAPSLQPRPGQRAEDLLAYLREGRHPRDAALGPMARVVTQSTQHWSPQDLQAAVRYLMSLPRQDAAQAAVPAAQAQRERGADVYARHCASCHGAQGQGMASAEGPRSRPAIVPLAGNPSVTQPALHNLVQMLRHGAFGAATAAQPLPFGMPPLTLSRADQAAVLTHLRQSWGHRAAPVSELDLVLIERALE